MPSCKKYLSKEFIDFFIGCCSVGFFFLFNIIVQYNHSSQYLKYQMQLDIFIKLNNQQYIYHV